MKFPLMCREKMKIENVCVDVLDMENLIVAVDGCDLTVERSQFFYRTNEKNRYGRPHMVTAGGAAKVTLRDVSFNEGLPTIVAQGTSSVVIEGGSYPGREALVANEKATISVTGANVTQVLAKGSSSILLGKGSKVALAESKDSSKIRIEDTTLGGDDPEPYKKNIVYASAYASDGGEISVARAELRAPPEFTALWASSGKASLEDSTLTGNQGFYGSNSTVTMKKVNINFIEHGFKLERSSSKATLEEVKFRLNPAGKPKRSTCTVVLHAAEAEIRGMDIEVQEGSGVCLSKLSNDLISPKVSITGARIKASAGGFMASEGELTATNFSILAGTSSAIYVSGKGTRVSLIDGDISSSGKAITIENSSVELKNTSIRGEKKTGIFSETIR